MNYCQFSLPFLTTLNDHTVVFLTKILLDGFPLIAEFIEGSSGQPC